MCGIVMGIQEILRKRSTVRGNLLSEEVSRRGSEWEEDDDCKELTVCRVGV